MARHDARTYQLRRFRVAMLAVLTLPWFLAVLLVPFLGWHMSVVRTAIALAVDALLLFCAWRNPAGVAAILIIVRLALTSALWFWWGNDVAVGVYAAFLGAGAVLLAVLLAPM